MNVDLLSILGNGFLEIFGSPKVTSFIIIFFIVYMLLTVGAGKSVITLILIPLVTTLSSIGISSYIGISGAFVWVSLGLWLILGIIFAGVYWVIVQ